MPSSHVILCCPLLLLPSIPPSIRVFSNELTLRMRWPKYWSFSFSIIPSKEHPRLISFRMDWLDLLAVQGTLKSLLQHHSSKASILQHSAFFTFQLSHPYMTTGKAKALTRQTFVGNYTQYQNMGIMTNTHSLNMYILYLCRVCIIYSFCVSPPSRPILCSSPSLASAGWSLQTISPRFPSNWLQLDLASGKHQVDSQRARGEREGRCFYPAPLALCHGSPRHGIPRGPQLFLSCPSSMALFGHPNAASLLVASLWLIAFFNLSYICANSYFIKCTSFALYEWNSVFCWNSAVVQSLSVPDSSWPQGMQHTRLLCPSLSPRICSNSCPRSQWHCLTTSSSAACPLLCLPSS